MDNNDNKLSLDKRNTFIHCLAFYFLVILKKNTQFNWKFVQKTQKNGVIKFVFVGACIWMMWDLFLFSTSGLAMCFWWWDDDSKIHRKTNTYTLKQKMAIYIERETNEWTTFSSLFYHILCLNFNIFSFFRCFLSKYERIKKTSQTQL